MSDIPSVDEVRETFADAFNGPARDAARVEFDRWLAAERARVWDEAADQIEIASRRESAITDYLKDVNPYREAQ